MLFDIFLYALAITAVLTFYGSGTRYSQPEPTVAEAIAPTEPDPAPLAAEAEVEESGVTPHPDESPDEVAIAESPIPTLAAEAVEEPEVAPDEATIAQLLEIAPDSPAKTDYQWIDTSIQTLIAVGQIEGIRNARKWRNPDRAIATLTAHYGGN